MDEYFGFLGLEITASADEIKAAYKARALVFHPDKYQQCPAATQEYVAIQMARLNEAKDKALAFSKTYDYLISDAPRSTTSQGGDQSPGRKAADRSRTRSTENRPNNPKNHHSGSPQNGGSATSGSQPPEDGTSSQTWSEEDLKRFHEWLPAWDVFKTKFPHGQRSRNDFATYLGHKPPQATWRSFRRWVNLTGRR